MNINIAPKKDIPELTGLRGIAAGAVLLNHLLLLIPYLKTTFLLRPLSMCGGLGMSLFFILSGIVIYYNYADKILNNPAEEMPKFFLARFARLYPLYFLFIVTFFIANTFFFGHSGKLLAADVTSLPLFLFGLQDWVYGYINDFYIVHLQGSANISWSISCEFALYLLFIPFILLIKPKNSIKEAIIFFVSALLLRQVYIYFSYFDMTLSNMWEKVYPGHSNEAKFYMVFHSPIARFFEFVTGCAIACFIKSNKGYPQNVERIFTGVMYICLGVLFLMAMKVINLPLDEVMLISPVLSLICLSISIRGSKLLKSRFFIFLGEISYSTYLLHIWIIDTIKYMGEDKFLMFGLGIEFFILTYLLSYFCYKYYEIPMKNRIKKFFMVKNQEALYVHN